MSALHSDPVLILGMHRSGTSYLANRMQALGVDVGSDLIGPQLGNPRGHFEDREILHFHEQLIAARRRQIGWAFDDGMMVTEPLEASWTPEEQARAEALIDARRGSSARFWGWKEPRTALFIDSWKALLPDLRGVVIYRHPLAVHLSALRRRHWDLALFPAQVFQAYTIYNQALIRAVRAHPEQFLVVHADTAFSDLHRLDDALRSFLKLPAEPVAPLPEFHVGEFADGSVSPAAEALLRSIAPEALAAYDTLNQLARIPQLVPSPADEGSEDGGWEWPEMVRNWTAAQRAMLIPLFEVIWYEHHCAPSLLRQELAEEIGKKVRATEEWNRRAEQVFADNARLDEERTRLGNAFAGQQAFLQKQTTDFAKLWEDHKKLGNDWVRQNERVAAFAAHVRTLESRLREAGEEPPPLPESCL